ncbi:MAG: hypothetical protein RLY20_1830 [Verrucomicrobiota bacterium]|jgi:hypothetical protein
MSNTFAASCTRTFSLTCGIGLLLLTHGFSRAEAPRFVVEDDAFLDQVCAAAAKLKNAGKLVPLEKLQCQLNRQYSSVKPASESPRKFSPPDLYDRLLQSTLAVGDFYQCDTCTNWHFMAATAFVVSSDGIISTSYHVVGNGEEPLTDKPDFLVAADHDGNVYPVREVLAADADADTCLLKIDATNLTPLPLRANARTGERVYCLGHPEGYHFLFSEGIVARLMRSRDTMSILEPDGEHTGKARPSLYLNVTAEFAPGSSGGPIVDEAGNVLGQVQSITSNVEEESTNKSGGSFVSGPVRFCVATEEILRLMQPPAGYRQPAPLPKPPGFQPSAALSEPDLMNMTRSLFARGSNALTVLDAPAAGSTLFKRFDACVQAMNTRFPSRTNATELGLLQIRAWLLRDQHHCDQSLKDPQALLKSVAAQTGMSIEQNAELDRLELLCDARHVNSGARLANWEQAIERHRVRFPIDPATELDMERLNLVQAFAPRRLETLAHRLAESSDPVLAAAAKAKQEEVRPSRFQRSRSQAQ